MVNCNVTLTKPSGEKFLFSYDNAKLLFLKRFSMGNLNSIFPQNFDLIEPLETSEQDLVVYKIYRDLASCYEDNCKITIEILDLDLIDQMDPLVIYDDYAFSITYTIITNDEVNNTIRATYPSKYYGNIRMSNKQEMI